MIPATAYHLALALERAAPPKCGTCQHFEPKKLIEEAMPKKPTPIPGRYAVETDAAGKTKIKPKRKARSTSQEIASRKRKKWRAAK